MRYRTNQRLYQGAICCIASCWALAALAAEPGTTIVYRSVGPNGIVSFSDAPNPSSVPVEVSPPAAPLEDDVERATKVYEQQLALLEILETNQRARVAQELEQQRIDLDYVRTEAALERARELQSPAEETRYYPIYAPPYWGSPRPPWIKPPHVDPPPARPSPPQYIQFPHR